MLPGPPSHATSCAKGASGRSSLAMARLVVACAIVFGTFETVSAVEAASGRQAPWVFGQPPPGDGHRRMTPVIRQQAGDEQWHVIRRPGELHLDGAARGAALAELARGSAAHAAVGERAASSDGGQGFVIFLVVILILLLIFGLFLLYLRERDPERYQAIMEFFGRTGAAARAGIVTGMAAGAAAAKQASADAAERQKQDKAAGESRQPQPESSASPAAPVATENPDLQPAVAAAVAAVAAASSPATATAVAAALSAADVSQAVAAGTVASNMLAAAGPETAIKVATAGASVAKA